MKFWEEEAAAFTGKTEKKEKSGFTFPDRIPDRFPEAEQIKKVQLYCLRLLTGRDRTVKQVRDKLNEKGYEEEVIQFCLDWLLSLHYLDDLRYAEHYIRTNCEKKSGLKIRMDLKTKGVEEEVIREAFENAEIPTDAEEKQIFSELKKKQYRPDAETKEKQKITASLMRKGFSGSAIFSCIRTYERQWEETAYFND